MFLKLRLSPSVVPVGNDMIPWIWGTRGKQSQSITSITGKYGFIWLHMTSTGMTRLVISTCHHVLIEDMAADGDCQHSPSAYRATVVGVGTAARTCLWCLCLQTPGRVAAPATGGRWMFGPSPVGSQVELRRDSTKQKFGRGALLGISQ